MSRGEEDGRGVLQSRPWSTEITDGISAEQGMVELVSKVFGLDMGHCGGDSWVDRGFRMSTHENLPQSGWLPTKVGGEYTQPASPNLPQQIFLAHT